MYNLFLAGVQISFAAAVSFPGNVWSKTAALLGYGGASKGIIPVSVKTMESVLPYECALQVFLLMLCYSLFIAAIMLCLNLFIGNAAGVIGAFAVNIYGFLLNPNLFQKLFQLTENQVYRANVLCGWLSPLNHATFPMHNFGYDYLPKLRLSIGMFLSVILFLLIVSGIKMREIASLCSCRRMNKRVDKKEVKEKMKAAVKLIKLSKSFGKEQVLKEISHSFEAGKIHGIMGFNGSGKTVMFKCICGFLKPDSGYVNVQGKRIGKDVDFPELIGMIIENPGFLPHLSGYANLKRLAELQRIIGKAEVSEAMIRVGLDPFSKKKSRAVFSGDAGKAWNRTGDYGKSGAAHIGRAF